MGNARLPESLKRRRQHFFAIPAQAGIQHFRQPDSRLRGNDDTRMERLTGRFYSTTTSSSKSPSFVNRAITVSCSMK